jgi:nitroimidazol reductase NimA-like FMN-containing flavoprotein (pyridoxamine 5'-phosphate oxidase superfamily)
VLHVSFVPSNDDPFPTILPYIGCTAAYGSRGEDANGSRDIYLHGYVSSRLMRAGQEGTPVCIAATHVDGVVLALTPHDHSNNYRSAVAHGYAHLVTNEAEKLFAMEAITNNAVAKRWENSRIPPTKSELQGTGVLRVEIVTASAKKRAGQPHSNRNDLKNEELTQRVWTGVIPQYLVYGEPVADDSNKVAKVPEYIKDWVESENTKNRGAAYKALEEDGEPPKALAVQTSSKSFWKWS